jgi:DNA-binding transcriptional MerR regulator
MCAAIEIRRGEPMTLLAPKEVGRRLQLSTSRIAQLDREGRLPSIRDSSGRRLFTEEVVEQFAREREVRRGAGAATAG